MPGGIGLGRSLINDHSVMISALSDLYLTSTLFNVACTHPSHRPW